MMKKVFALAMAAALALSLVACGQKKVEEKTVDLSTFGQEYVDAQQMPPLLDTGADMGKQILDMYYAGLSEMELAQLYPYVSMMSINNSELVVAQAKSAEDAAKVQEIFQARIDGMVNGGTLYPETIEIWSNSAQVVTNGNYVMLVASTDKDAIVEAFNALFQ